MPIPRAEKSTRKVLRPTCEYEKPASEKKSRHTLRYEDAEGKRIRTRNHPSSYK